MAVTVSASGEVGDFTDVDQFQVGATQFACGFFAVAIVKAMHEVGQPPEEGQSVAQMIAEALAWYRQYDGDPSWKNTSGMELWQLYSLIIQVGLHYQATTTNDPDMLHAWLALGYPIIVAGAEIGYYDLGLQDKVPYPWNASGNHVIVLTGNHDKHFFVRDSANCTDLYNPQSLRPGPRIYDGTKMQLISATVVVPPWLPRPPEGFDPRKEEGKDMNIVPLKWSDDGTTLTAPNGRKVTQGFRTYVLTHNWDAGDMPLEDVHPQNPLEESNPTLGAGTQQCFVQSVLEWTPTRGVFKGYGGQEILARRKREEALLAQLAKAQESQPSLAQAISKLLEPYLAEIGGGGKKG